MSRNKPGFRAGRDQGAVTENMELLTGQRGNGLDRAITLRDLADLGLAKLRRLGQGGAVVPDVNPDLTPGADAQRPTRPTNVLANGAFHNIILTWNEPTYRGHAYAEIWRAPVDNLAEAVVVGTTNAHVYADSVGGALKAWYWVRFINIADVEGPYSGPGGVYAETSRAIDDILEEMAGEVSESFLTKHLQDRIDLIDGPATLPGSVSAKVKQEQTERTSADSALGKRVDTVQAQANDSFAAVQQVSQAVATIDSKGSAAYQALWSIKAQAGDITAGIGLIAGSGGKSEVTVAAGRFSVYDPASPISKSNLFVIEQGKVYMNTAFIKQAYIEGLAAAQITADKVNTLNLNAVNITGGSIKGATINIGANFSVGNAGNMRATNMEAHNATLTGNLTVPDASIKRAHIGHAEVDTLRIAGNSVIIPIGMNFSNQISGTSTMNVGSLTFNATGDPMEVVASMAIDSSATATSQTGGALFNTAHRMSVLLNGGSLWAGAIGVMSQTGTQYVDAAGGTTRTVYYYNISGVSEISMLINPPAGNNTITIQYHPGSGGGITQRRYIGLKQLRR